MEDMETLMRGVVVQNPGVGLGSIRFLVSEWAWAAVLAIVVIALVSVKRVSFVRVGWSWGAKPGQVRLLLHSFSSMSDGSIVTASGMFSAKILNCSSDSCNEADSKTSACASEAASKMAAEMVFIFEKKTSPCLLLPEKQPFAASAFSEKIVLRRTKSAGSRTIIDRSSLTPIQRVACAAAVVKRQGVDWDKSPVSLSSRNADSILPVWAPYLTEPFACIAPIFPSCQVSKPPSHEWDPLLRLRVRDAIFGSRHPVYQSRETIALIASSQANDVVRLWDSKTDQTPKMLHLLKRFSGMVTAFDVHREPKAADIGNVEGLLCIANLECPAFEKSYQTYHSVIHRGHMGGTVTSNTLFAGGPVMANPGCSVSLWDRRAKNRQMLLNLSSVSTIYGIRSEVYELYVRDRAASLGVHDVRMLRPSSLRRVPCDMSYGSGPKHSLWDVYMSVKSANGDVDSGFWNHHASNVERTTSMSFMCSFVTAIDLNFTAQTPPL